MNIYNKAETDSWIQRTNQWLPVGRGKRGGARYGQGIKRLKTTMYKINKQHRYNVQHREIQPLFCNNFKWSISYKNIESLCCTPDISIILYINYTSI